MSDFKKMLSHLGTFIAAAAAVLAVIYVFRRIANIAQNSAPSLGSSLDIVVHGIFLLGALYLFGLFCAWKFTGGIADSFITFCLYPRRYLKTPPVILSRQQGLIAAQRFQEAELELIELRSQHPSSPEIALMLGDLHAEKFNDLPGALADFQFYFQHRRRRRNELDFTILLRCTDCLCQLGQHPEAVTLLQQEQQSALYSENERKVLGTRLRSIIASQKSTEE